MRPVYTTLLILAALVLWAGCATQKSQRNTTLCENRKPCRITRIAAVYSNAGKRQEEIAYAGLREAISQERIDGTARYRSADFRLLSAHRIIRQAPFPRDAEIVRAYVSESGVDESERCDIAATVFIVPGTRPTYLWEGIPSKGAMTEYYHIYDLGHLGKVLVITESGPSQLGGSVRFVLWDVLANRVKTLQSWAGEQDGKDFCHEMRLRENGPEVVIHGFYSIKRANGAYEEDRRGLEKALGIAVELVLHDF